MKKYLIILMLTTPAIAQTTDANLEVAYKICMGHYHAASPMRAGRPESWDAGFENCAAIKATYEARGLAATSKAVKDKAAIDAIAKGLKN